MTSPITLPHDWRPRAYQLPSWRAWERGARRSLLVWHRRAGKDDVALHKTAVAAHLRVGNYWHMLPEYAQARKAVWSAVNPHTGRRRIDEAFPAALRASTNEQEMFIRFRNGSTWQLMGSDRYDSLVGTPPVGVVMSEFALANPSAWGYLAPILLENGGWADFITTPRGKNHVHGMLKMARAQMEAGNPEWYAEVLPYTATGAISGVAVEAQRLEYRALYGEEAGDALIDQEYLCSFDAAVLGAYWGRALAEAERKGRIRHLEYEPTLPVHTAWDLGIGDATAIWFFQVLGGEVRVLDFFESHGVGIAPGGQGTSYSEVLRARRELWGADGARNGNDYVPHDARVRELGTGRTRVETMLQCGLNPRVVPAHKVMDGINAVRRMIERVWWCAGTCEAGLERLRQYRAAWDDKRKVFLDAPLHDWTSHAADAARYMAMAWEELAPTSTPKRRKRLSVGAGNEVTLPDAWAASSTAGGRI